MASEYRIVNTTVSGSALVAGLTGNDVRALQFDAATKQPRAKPIGQAETVNLNTEDLAQAAIGTLLFNVNSTGPVFVNVGPDTAPQAALYQNLFNMRSAGEERLLRFGLAGATGSTILLRNATGNSNNNIQINVQGVTVNPTPSQVLFNANASAGAGANCAGDGAGLERLVILRALSTTPNAQVVQFNILPKSV